MPRCFRRFAEGVFDVNDLKARTNELAEFIDGYSNGANIAAGLILLHPHYLKASVLFRPVVPFRPDIVRNFSELSVCIRAGDQDAIIARNQPQELAAILESGGADASISWHRGGHELGDDAIDAARTWLSAKVKSKIAA